MEKLERLVRYGDRMGKSYITVTLCTPLTFSLANRDHSKLKQGLNRRKGGHERLLKSYEKLRQDMQDLIDCGKAPLGAVVPNRLPIEKLWDLDVDDDLWMDLTRDAQQQDDARDQWLYDQQTQRGIRAMLDLQRSEEEIERLEHEGRVMSTWLRGQGKRLKLACHMAQGIQPIFRHFTILIQPNPRQYCTVLPDQTARRQPHSDRSGLGHKFRFRHWQ